MTLFKKDEWVAALRSGDYLQAKGWLRSTNVDTNGVEIARYCCLGVYAEICDVKFELTEDSDFIFDFLFPVRNGVASTSELPDEDWAEEKGIPVAIMQELAEMNDSGSWSFDQIASWIETYDW